MLCIIFLPRVSLQHKSHRRLPWTRRDTFSAHLMLRCINFCPPIHLGLWDLPCALHSWECMSEKCRVYSIRFFIYERMYVWKVSHLFHHSWLLAEFCRSLVWESLTPDNHDALTMAKDPIDFLWFKGPVIYYRGRGSKFLENINFSYTPYLESKIFIHPLQQPGNFHRPPYSCISQFIFVDPFLSMALVRVWSKQGPLKMN